MTSPQGKGSPEALGTDEGKMKKAGSPRLQGGVGGDNLTEIERNKKISAEYQRISIYFESLDENEKAVIDPLIRNASFMRIALDDLQEIIAEQGPVEAYQNGQFQSGMKQSAALQSYNSLVKNYAAVIKTLFGLLPKMVRPHVSVVFEKPKENLEEEQRREVEKRKADFAAACDYQKWQKAEEAAGRKVTMSFGQWREENNR